MPHFLPLMLFIIFIRYAMLLPLATDKPKVFEPRRAFINQAEFFKTRRQKLLLYYAHE